MYECREKRSNGVTVYRRFKPETLKSFRRDTCLTGPLSHSTKKETDKQLQHFQDNLNVKCDYTGSPRRLQLANSSASHDRPMPIDMNIYVSRHTHAVFPEQMFESQLRQSVTVIPPSSTQQSCYLFSASECQNVEPKPRHRD